ncbi:hypothetical protein DEU56DRAFT_918554 [Suillus clintonianus]|uniref:uncharacterized protein n=1 Tax=Suillus clintonianus TaxID=1904413 RepID=UPI001B87BB8D|nr:uncharacterized protein DEU56DRAFT_918554 [Suillus clintonianus]KAG2119387.1 hypothetical protein DEU56DRAFT_918554 [Suillus clintonianus]
MSLVDLNLTNKYLQTDVASPSHPISNFTLRPDELELAVAKAAVQLIGISNEGLRSSIGMTYVDEEFFALRLNLSFAVSASVIMLRLALHMTRVFNASRDSWAAIPKIGILQLLWLGHRSTSINEALEDVEHPTEANLRRAIMTMGCDLGSRIVGWRTAA